jgi:hypothetical protein
MKLKSHVTCAGRFGQRGVSQKVCVGAERRQVYLNEQGVCVAQKSSARQLRKTEATIKGSMCYREGKLIVREVTWFFKLIA